MDSLMIKDFIIRTFSTNNFIIIFFIFILISSNAIAAEINTPINPQHYQELIGIGINVNWVMFDKIMSAYKTAHDKGISIPLIFKERGFSNVRIRVKDFPLNSRLKDGLTLMQQLKMVVDDCLKAKIVPIITFSANNFREDPDTQTLEQSVKFWKEVATEFKNYPYLLSYDLMIESSGNISQHDDMLNEFYKVAIAEIRKIDKFRILFITPNGTSNPYNLTKLWYPKDDKYIMIEWHFYASGPSKRNKQKLWTTGTQQERDLALNKINFAKKWCESHGLYSWNGAWMPTNFNHCKNPVKMPDGAPMGDYSLQQELSFTKFISSSLKKVNIPFSINAGFKFFDYSRLKWYDSTSKVLDTLF